MASKINALKRIQKDLQKINSDADSGFIVNPDQNNLFQIPAYIAGPQGTIWQGGIFELAFTFPQNYPHACPTVVFKSKMFHPNIYHDGRICLDLIANQWSSSYDMTAILVSIRSLLSYPNPNSPANKQACEVYTKSEIEYERRVKQIVRLSQQQEMEEE